MKKGTGVITGEDFRRMQLLELDMLVEMDRICRKHNIRYTITSGTLLGAVRHKGYIPWDDDADVAMLREEYEKFRRVSHELNPEICFFQDHDTEKEYIWGYGKLRRTGTTYIRPGQEKQKFRTGVYVDIMPCDDIPKSVPGQMIMDFYCFCLRKILWSNIGKDDTKNPILERIMYKMLSRINPEFVFKRIGKMAARSSNKSPNLVRVLMLPSGGKERKLYSGKNSVSTRYGSPKEWYLDVIEMDFEGHKLYGTKDYDSILTYIYGDYMQLPPESEREQHSPFSAIRFPDE